jgi:hypothetical protein
VADALVAELNRAGGAAFAAPLLLRSWTAHLRSRRLATPFARVADLLFTRLDMRAMADSDATFTDVSGDGVY